MSESRMEHETKGLTVKVLNSMVPGMEIEGMEG